MRAWTNTGDGGEQLSRSSLHNNIIVRWPSYFVGEGLRLLYCGAFDEGELPYDFRNRQGTVPLPPLQSCQHQGEKDCIAQYLEARHQARQTLNRYWFELAAPDGRPYFYDFVSHMHK